ncbi:inositol-tetrakisphosphate 1-kinase 3-like isoform X2 [Rhodamnia argentea]|uniref:Inositol-tetrakisphosphate 1-kinase n=1 Tax=Rhodamnia argentea TaxID=178133 RepID=A0A8B8NLG5_9MYRT|nr:inositol-tetrakisphosphate 1-kinase 3-like isoform X2 [Rhodamnia argentea]
MRLSGAISSEDEEEKEKQANSHICPSSLNVDYKVVVGYALTSKKKKSFLQPKLEGLARNKGILFVAIDLSKPLADQGPFNVVLHKDYQRKHPEVAVVDPPDAIEHLLDRQSMLQDVADLNMHGCYGTVGVPKQLVIREDSQSIPCEVAEAGLSLPLVAKPLVVDGSPKSHELFLAYDRYSLVELGPPLVLQEFVNHGGVLFKVYIIGDSIKVVRRFSLPNISRRELSKVTGVFPFPRVSSAASSAEDADLDPGVAELPPRPLLEKLAKELRHRLGLQLFNIDLIREQANRDMYFVIDINYFPGYGKLPGYEHMFTDFLLSVSKSEGRTGTMGSKFQLYMQY